MTRRIVVYAINDFTLRKAGSHVRMAELAGAIEEQFPGSIVYGFHESSDSPWDDAAAARFAVQHPRLELVRDHRTARFNLFTRLKTAVLQLAPARAQAILRWYDPGSTPNWARIRRDPDNHLVIVNWVDGAAWLNGLPDGPFWVESHDVKFLKYAKRTGQPVHSAAVTRRLRGEAAVLAAASGIVSISPVDQAILGALAPATPNFYVPAHLASFDPPAPEASAPFVYDLLFVGARNTFNVEGLSGFITANAGWLAGRKLAVAGSVSTDPQAQAALALVPGAEVLGFVDDLAPVYARSKAVISPVDGTGLKIKVIDALRHGKPVFASRHSRDGLPPGFEACVFDCDPAAMDRLLANDAALEEAMGAARAYCRTLGSAGEREAFLTALRAQTETGARP